MIKIAHRGNINGPDKTNENSPRHIQKAISLGFDVEVDIWGFGEQLYLGHDNPTYSLDSDFLLQIKEKAWFHCKNLHAVTLISQVDNTNYFWHQEDQFTLTSLNFIWTNSNQETTSKSILVDISNSVDKSDLTMYGFCSDYLV